MAAQLLFVVAVDKTGNKVYYNTKWNSQTPKPV